MCMDMCIVTCIRACVYVISCLSSSKCYAVFYHTVFTEYAKWWAPIAEDIVIDKSKGKKPTMTQNANGKEVRYFI